MRNIKELEEELQKNMDELKKLHEEKLDKLNVCGEIRNEQLQSYKKRNTAHKIGWISSLVTVGAGILSVVGAFINPVVSMVFAGITLASYGIGVLPGFITAYAYSREISKKDKIIEEHEKGAADIEDQRQLILEKNNVLNQDLQEAKNKVDEAKEKVAKAKSKVTDPKKKTTTKAPTTRKKKTNTETAKR